MIETPVLIVGGGPVGLTLSLLLSRAGVQSLLVNDRTGTTTHPKLDVVNCRSMEIFRQLGIADAIRAAGNPVEANQYSAFAASVAGPFYTVMSDRHLVYKSVTQARADIRACTDGSLPLEPMQRIAQMHLEPVLLEAASADPNIDVRFGWRLYGFEQDAEGVTAMAQSIDGTRSITVRSKYLIGCDGPNSRVRNFMNIDYEGTRDLIGNLFIIHLRSKQIADLYPNRQPYWHTWLSRPGFHGLLVSPDASRDDYVLHRAFPPREGESLEAIVRSALGRDLEFEIVQSGPWRPQFLVANSFGRGRVFLAGDATHQYMPTGGLGMNTGIAEAHNLAWKLSASIQGWGSPELVASYEAERLPVARRNCDHVKKCAAAAFEPNFATTPETKAKEFEEKISRLYESLGAEIGYRYHDSPIVLDDGSSEPAYEERGYVATTFPGARLPSAFLETGQAVFDALRPDGFTLLALRPEAEELAMMQAAADACRVPYAVVSYHDARLASIYERKFVLVRPDQHVAWRGDRLPDDCSALFDAVRGAAMVTA